MRQIGAVFVALIAAGLSLYASPAQANPRYAAYVVSADTGEVFMARNADAARYPASLTKMMTLYMLLEAVDAGQLDMDTVLIASAEAASRPSSNLRLSAGDTLTVEQAIQALLVRSANDVAVVVAERLADTEDAFAEAMTERARELGLENTVFQNASGLHDRNQRTTARDMARLGEALIEDFTHYAAYFDDQRFTYAGRTWRSHNGLLGRVEGVDGLKTGYIRASGFNIVVSAERYGERLIAVVMGGRRSSTRDAHAADILDQAYNIVGARQDRVVLATLDSPRLNPIRDQELMVAELGAPPADVAQGDGAGAPAVSVVLEDADEVWTPAPALQARLVEAPQVQASQGGDADIQLANNAFSAEQTPPGAIWSIEPAGQGDGGALELAEPVIAAPVRGGVGAASPAPAASASALWGAQVGAYLSRPEAEARLSALTADESLGLVGAERQIEWVERAGRTLWRARFAGLEADAAQAVCETLAARRQDCFTIAP